jgi:hypothetical protein
MAFALCHHYWFLVFGPMRDEVLLCEGLRAGSRTGYGTATNLSNRNWTTYGNVPVAVGNVCSLKVRLSVRK